ncbi:hypothetical protein SSX86_004508 [Deinandra increscens subsp. villosa]|uniref:C3H1-type domain-containing protein n=1 Tax=Deinandra increscens subsp. villosa TaxID=3103831 RepID=A0AAP0DN45_9ASTR
MSGRRRRSETSWDDKEEKGPSALIHANVSPGRSHNWSKSEVHEDLMHGNFSRSPSWDTLQGNRNRPKGDGSRRDGNRMYSHPNFDGWDKQYSTHPSDDRYDRPYRSRDKGVGSNVRMSRERERSRSPKRSRSRSRDGMSRSSREGSRGHRHETNASYPNMRSNSKDFASRNNITENWGRRTDYKDGSRYNDYSHRNAYDNHRNTRVSCKFFAAGNCNRDNCKFSHDVPEGAAGGYGENRNSGNRNRTWRDDQQLHDDLDAKSNLGEMKKKSWNSSSWDDVKSGGLDDNNNNTTWASVEDKKKLSDGYASQDASGFQDFGKSHRNLDNKKGSWNGPTSWDGVSGSGFSNVSNPCDKYEESAKESLNDNNAKGRMSAPSGSNTDRNIIKKWDGPLWDDFSDNQQPHDDLKAKSNLGEMEKKKSWNSSSWDDVKSGGFDETSRYDVKLDGFDKTSREVHTSDDNTNNTTWNSVEDKKKLLDKHASLDAPGFQDFGKSHRNLDNKKSSWNGPTSWDGVSGSGFSNVLNPCDKYEESAKESVNDNNAKGRMSAQSGTNTERNNNKKWDGPLWDDFSEPVAVKTDNSNIGNWGGPVLNRMSSDNVETVINDSDLNNIVPEDANPQILPSVHDMNTQSHSYLNGPEQSHMLLSNPFNGPLSGQVQGMYVHMENQTPKPLEVDVSQPQAAKHVNETSLTSQLPSQANALPAETSHKAQISQAYTDLHLSNAIDFLKSLPNSAYNQDTRPKEEQNSVIQQNQVPAVPTHDSSKLGGIGVLQKEAEEQTDKRVSTNGKKEEENTHPDNSEIPGKVEEGDIANDEKAMRQFKVGLVEFVKEILKPKWKEGKMSREVHKTVVKKVVEKVTSTIQGSQIPRTQPKIEQYLAYSKPKITKLVEAYMERLLKA